MKNIFLKLNLLVIIVLLVVACKSNSTSSSTEDVLNGQYEIKKAIVETKVEIKGLSTTTTQLLFDDYGKLHKQISKSMASVGLGNMNFVTHSLIQNDAIYTWNEGDSVGTKIKLDKVDQDLFSSNFNFKKIGEDFRKKYKLEEKGTVSIDGRQTTVYTLLVNGSKLTYYIWKNIPLEYEVEMAGKTIKSQLIRLDENPKFDKTTFELPSSVRFKDAEL